MITNDKKSFVLYNNYENQFKLLSMEERGQLITAIFEYSAWGEVDTELSPVANMAFSFIKETLDRDKESYLEKCEKNTENGKKGGRPRKNISASKTERFFEKPKKADNDIDNDNDNGIGNENEIENDIVIGNGIGEEYAQEEGLPQSSAPAHAPHLSEAEKRELIKKGLSESYVNERTERAFAYGQNRGMTTASVLEKWWQEDKRNRQAQRGRVGVLDSGAAKSYEIDEYFAAALDRSNSLIFDAV